MMSPTVILAVFLTHPKEMLYREGVSQVQDSCCNTFGAVKRMRLLHVEGGGSFFKQGAVSLRLRSSFSSTNYTSLGANSPPKSFSEMTPGNLSLLLLM